MTHPLANLLLDYAERLGQKTGAALTACAFVNSGSEANDVACRIATAWTGARGALTQEFAYHGITEAINAVSPSASRIGALAAHVRYPGAAEELRQRSLPARTRRGRAVHRR